MCFRLHGKRSLHCKPAGYQNKHLLKNHIRTYPLKTEIHEIVFCTCVPYYVFCTRSVLRFSIRDFLVRLKYLEDLAALGVQLSCMKIKLCSALGSLIKNANLSSVFNNLPWLRQSGKIRGCYEPITTRSQLVFLTETIS